MMPSRWVACAILLTGSACEAGAQQPPAAGPPGGSLRVGQVDVRIEYADEAAATVDSVVRDLVPRALEEYRRLFGGMPKDASGEEIVDLRIELSRAPRGEGNSDPGVVQVAMGDEPMFGFYDWQQVLLHELFHLWSAETFRYGTDAEQWFNEGAAELYALRTAARLGLIEPERVPANAATLVGFYLTSRNVERLSMREAGSTPENKRENYFLVYDGGFTAALVLDYEIRRRTEGRRSLDDLMRWLYVHFDAGERRYGMDDLVRGLRETGAGEFADFFSRHVDGRESIPVWRHLDLGRMSLELTRNAVRPAEQRQVTDETLAATLGIP
jgi:predicted metalloprotease with PDZ domain